MHGIILVNYVIEFVAMITVGQPLWILREWLEYVR